MTLSPASEWRRAAFIVLVFYIIYTGGIGCSTPHAACDNRHVGYDFCEELK